MKVPISLLLYKIKQKNNAVISRISQDISVGHPIFPDKAEKNKEHIVVVSNTQIPHFVAHKSFPLIVYADVDETVLQKTPGNYIAYPKGYSVFQVFNELTELFEIFEKWYSELDDALNQYYSYNAIINSCEIFISVPIALVDTQFKYVCYSKRLAAVTGYDKYVQNNIYLPLEDINYLNSLPDYKDLEEKTDVFHYVAVENLLHKNIFYNNTYIGRLSIPYSDDPVECQCYMQILNILSQYIEKLYDRFGTFRRLEPHDTELKELLTDLLYNRATDTTSLIKLLHEKSFQENDTFLLVCFTSVFTNNNEDTAMALAKRLEMQSSAVICLQFKTQIIALVNTDLYHRCSTDSFLQSLSYYLRDSLLKAGISREFHDLSTLPAAYKQTQIAFEIGSKQSSTLWSFQFDHYAFDYFLSHGLDDFTPEQICHPACLKIRAYDALHNTELEKTLRTYIASLYNSSACSRLLYINRSSFLKRMERIAQITKINFSDLRERLYLELSYSLL